MRGLFVDSGAFVAVANPGDQFEKDARTGWEKLARSTRPLFSSEHVLDEVATAICRMQSPRRAAVWVRQQLESDLIQWLRPSAEDFWNTVDLLEKYSDQRINFTDTISFALMRREKLDEVFTFDRHFALAGFQIWPPLS